MTEPATLLHRIEQVATDDPGRPALVFQDHVTDYDTLRMQAARVAAGLWELGVARGDRVAVMLDNCPEYFVASLAIWRLGAVQVPVNTALRAEEVRFVLEDAGATVVVAGERTSKIVAQARTDLPDLQHVVVVGCPPSCTTSRACAATPSWTSRPCGT